LFDVTAWQPAVKDLDLQSRKMRRYLYGIDGWALWSGAFELGQGGLPLLVERGSNRNRPQRISPDEVDRNRAAK
jgi:hypothetical protein